MGKAKKGNRFEKSTNQDKDNSLERLQAYAEKKGKQIWEVTFKDLEGEECSIEETEEESEEEIDEEENEQLEATKVIDDDKINQQEIKVTENKIELIEETISFEKIKIDLNDDKLLLESTKEIERKFPIILRLCDEITKRIEKSEIENILDESIPIDEIKIKRITFGNHKVIYEYPKEDKRHLEISPKKLNKYTKNSNIEKPEKKKKKKKGNFEEEVGEEELARLNEIKIKRDESAYLKKLKDEDADKKIMVDLCEILIEQERVKDKEKDMDNHIHNHKTKTKTKNKVKKKKGK